MAKNNKELTEEELVKRNKEQLAKAKEINSKQKENFEQLPSANTEEENYFLNDYEKNRNKIYKVKSNVEDSQKYVSEEEQNREIDYNNPDDGLILDIKDPFKLDKEYIEHLISAKDETVKLQKMGTNAATGNFVFIVVSVIVMIFVGIAALEIILVALGAAAGALLAGFTIGAPVFLIVGLIILIIRIFGKAARVDNENEIEGLKYYLAKLESNSYTYLGKPASEITFEFKKRVISEKIDQMNISYENIVKSPELSFFVKYLDINEEEFSKAKENVEIEVEAEKKTKKEGIFNRLSLALFITGLLLFFLFMPSINKGSDGGIYFSIVLVLVGFGTLGLFYSIFRNKK